MCRTQRKILRLCYAYVLPSVLRADMNLAEEKNRFNRMPINSISINLQIELLWFICIYICIRHLGDWPQNFHQYSKNTGKPLIVQWNKRNFKVDADEQREFFQFLIAPWTVELVYDIHSPHGAMTPIHHWLNQFLISLKSLTN